MRYIIRRQTPEDLEPLKKEFPNLESQLEKPGDGMKRVLSHAQGSLDRVNYLLLTKKSGSEWSWTCPSIELVSADEAGLFALMKRFSLPAPQHLAHLDLPKPT